MTADDLAALDAAIAETGRAVLVVIAAVAGSTPRETGAAIVVAGDGTATGTIGGGSAEHGALATARAMLAEAAPAPRVETFRLNPVLDQCCGGRMEVALAPFGPGDRPRLAHRDGTLVLWDDGPAIRVAPAPRPVHVYGGGHVGAALVAALAPLPFRVRWIDARKDGFHGPVPDGVAATLTPLPEAVATAAPAGAFHVVMTHSHALDLEIVAAVLEADGFGFLGLIGSATKRAVFEKRLAERGIGPDRVARLVCPIGLPGIAGKAPAVIAAATAAQLLREDDLAPAAARLAPAKGAADQPSPPASRVRAT